MTTLSRRTFLAASGVGAATLVTGLGTNVALGQSRGDKLVVVFLSGGADALNMTPPIGYDSYRSRRRVSGVPEPGEDGGMIPLHFRNSNRNAQFPTGLDGVVGLHPLLAPLHNSVWRQGRLAVVLSAGLPRAGRSHFSATRYSHRGAVPGGVAQGGWLGRLAQAAQQPQDDITGVFDRGTKPLLEGADKSIDLLGKLGSFGVNEFRNRSLAVAALRSVHLQQDSVSSTGRSAIDLIDEVTEVNANRGQGYPGGKLGSQLSEVASLFNSDLGVQGAGIRMSNWDHHRRGKVRFERHANELATGLRAFIDDTKLEGITLVVLSEFGRTVKEDGSGGTDHGAGYSALVMGSGIKGGVYGDFPETLQGIRELPVRVDYRQILSEIAHKRMDVTDTGALFPDYTQSGYLGLA